MAADPTDAKPAASRPTASLPLSPHLQIWRFTATMAASITQRATGVANFAGVILLAYWLLGAAHGPAFFAPVSGILNSPFGTVILTGFIWSLCFHMLGGLRYLYWDSGRGFDPKWANLTSWGLYAASIVLTAIIVIVGLSARVGA